MPALPGAQKISNGCLADLLRAQQRACSRPPDPTTRIFILMLLTEDRNAPTKHEIFRHKILLKSLTAHNHSHISAPADGCCIQLSKSIVSFFAASSYSFNQTCE